MDINTVDITLYAFIPLAFMVMGGLLGSLYRMGPIVESVTQHLVSGIVFAAVSVDLLPKILGSSSPWTVAGGFIVGVIVMLLLMGFTHHMEHRKEKSRLPVGLLSAILVDVFIDGMLIGIAFLAGRDSGFLILIALTACVFFLGMSVAMVLKNRLIPVMTCLLLVTSLAIAIPLGTFLGSTVINYLPPAWLTEALAFGVAALLYLGAEELLVEAHKGEDSPWVTSAFFIGFLAILLLKL